LVFRDPQQKSLLNRAIWQIQQSDTRGWVGWWRGLGVGLGRWGLRGFVRVIGCRSFGCDACGERAHQGGLDRLENLAPDGAKEAATTFREVLRPAVFTRINGVTVVPAALGHQRLFDLREPAQRLLFLGRHERRGSREARDCGARHHHPRMFLRPRLGIGAVAQAARQVPERRGQGFARLVRLLLEELGFAGGAFRLLVRLAVPVRGRRVRIGRAGAAVGIHTS